MTPAAKLSGFAAGLAVVFGGAALAGGAVEPGTPGGAREDHDASPVAQARPVAAGHGAAADAAEEHRPATPVRGLSGAANGLRLALDTPELPRGRRTELRFRVLGADGRPARDLEVEHERRVHLIVVRRDLTGFQHLHPRQGRDGTWRIALRIPAAGVHRVYADVVRDGRAATLAADLRVDGPADLRALPAPATVATATGGDEVRLDAPRSRAGREGELRFTVRRGGRTIRPEPYLGARGHLVALREDDLGFLHVHPVDDAVAFATTFPTAGRYRLFLQYRHAGAVRTAAFTREVTR